jgi:hypothetical protein
MSRPIDARQWASRQPKPGSVARATRARSIQAYAPARHSKKMWVDSKRTARVRAAESFTSSTILPS